MKKRLQKIFWLVTEYNIFFSIKYCYFKITKQQDKFIKLVYDYLADFCKEDIELYNNKDFNVGDKNFGKKIWVCWWQGEEKMPVLCKKCFKSLQQAVGDMYEVILITKNNYQDYVDIDKNIIIKLEKEIISVTQFSDILRERLIYQHGGLWIDSSVFVAGNIDSIIENMEGFWSVKLNSIDDLTNEGQAISKCIWSGFILGGSPENDIYKFLYNSMTKYYRKHNFTITYFIQNIFLRIAYDKIPTFTKEIDRIKPSNPKLYELYRILENEYDDNVYKELVKDTQLFKLTWKRDYSSKKDGTLTFYGKLIK